MSITPEYQKQLKEMHEGRIQAKKWGTTGGRNFGDYVVRFLEQRRPYISTVLDFGAGQQSLQKYVMEKAIDIKINWTNYDPGVPGLDNLPEESFDLVVSSDVLEHVEPEEIDKTIVQLDQLTNKYQFHHIACDPCGLILPDGRNAHLITEKLEWWIERFGRTGSYDVMYKAQCTVKKRGYYRDHVHIQLDKL